MIQQVRLKENYTPPGSTFSSTRRVFGFGSHPQATETDQHPVTSASATGNAFRIIMDELLIGNNLEEVACRAAVGVNGAYQAVPVGTTPDDIAKCAAAQDVLPRTCGGQHATCLCELEAGCTVGAETIAVGKPVGVLDINQDGAADDTRFIQGSVGIQCGTIDVPIDLDMSYWNPSGNQQVPAMGGFEALGPAIVLVPLSGLPTNLGCSLKFSDTIVDKQRQGVCAPAGGDMDAGCTPGDVSAFSFTVEPLSVTPGSFLNAATGVNKSEPVLLIANTPLAAATVTAANITITPAPPVAPVVTLEMGRNIKLTFATPLAPLTQYTITLGEGITDTFGQPLPDPIVFTFTTGA